MCFESAIQGYSLFRQLSHRDWLQYLNTQMTLCVASCTKSTAAFFLSVDFLKISVNKLTCYGKAVIVIVRDLSRILVILFNVLQTTS